MKSFLIISTLLISLFLVPTTVLAQSTLQDGSSGTTGNSTQVNGQTSTTNDDRGGFQWWWLLPLLAIPIFFVIKSDKREDERVVTRDRGYAGVKGGEARRREVEEDEEVTEREEVI